MSKYVPMPTTAQMREMCADDGGLAEYHDPINGHRQAAESRKMFDRWLVTHDAELLASQRTGAEVKAEALREAADGWHETHDPSSYEASDWLNARADALAPATPTTNGDTE